MTREKLVREFFSIHYERFMPKTERGWQWVLDRIELNFGEFFNNIAQNSPILDLACGVGYLEHYLLKKGFNNIDAVDLSQEQIQVAKDKLQEYGFNYAGKVEFHLADAFKYLEKSKNKYTVIAMIDFLDHLKKDEVIKIMNLANNALTGGGFLFLRATNTDNPMWGQFFYRDFTHETPFTPNSLRQCLSVSGFDIIKIGYEIIPKIRRSKLELTSYLKRFVRWVGLWFLGKLLDVSPDAFTEDLIAVAKKR